MATRLLHGTNVVFVTYSVTVVVVVSVVVTVDSLLEDFVEVVELLGVIGLDVDEVIVTL